MVWQLISRAQCHLCEEMKAILDRELSVRGITYETVDVDSELTLKQRYGDVVPVLLRDGKPVAKVRIQKVDLERILSRRRKA